MKTKIFSIILLAIFSLNSLYASENKIKSSEKLKPLSLEIPEMELELEPWMTSVKEFNFNIRESFDFELNFESWMLKTFPIENSESSYKEMEFESWMLQPFHLEDESGFADKELRFESWMLKF